MFLIIYSTYDVTLVLFSINTHCHMHHLVFLKNYDAKEKNLTNPGTSKNSPWIVPSFTVMTR